MFPNSPRHDPWHHDPRHDEPSSFERGYDLFMAARSQLGLIGLSSLVSVGPFPSILMWRVYFRGGLVGPPALTARAQTAHGRGAQAFETLATLSLIPAFLFVATIGFSLYYILWDEDKRLIGWLSLAALALIGGYGLLRLGLFVRG